MLLKIVGLVVAGVLAAAAGAGAFALFAAFPLMLVLGALHSSSGLEAVPALGFWQTLGSLFVIAAVGRAFTPSPGVKTTETD